MPTAVQEINRKPKNVKVLVVEDDDFARKIILRVLHDLGYINIVDTDNAASAIRQFETNTFDLIVTDLNMPGMNVLELVQKVRAGKTLAKRETRIMVLTSFSQTEVLASALALDINGFLVKPFIPAVLEEKLIQAMSERLHLHSPIAYEAVKTTSKGLPDDDNRQCNTQRDTSNSLSDPKTRINQESLDGERLPLLRLRPGMLLRENIYLKDGTLVLSSGYALSELSINRLKDIEALLPRGEVVVIPDD